MPSIDSHHHLAERHRMGRRRAAAVLTLLIVAACDGKPGAGAANAAPAAPPPPQVSVVTLRQQAAPVTTVLPGRTAAYRVAEVRPQVGGVLRERLFTEGQEVTAGQPLFRIDPAPFQASLETAEAALARAQATAQSAEVTVNRYRPLVRARAVSQQDFDLAEAALHQAQADVSSAQASVDTARINLGYTVVNSPIDGRTGRSSVTVGALVTASQASALVTVTQLNPIYVDMTQPSAALLRQRRDIAEGVLRRDVADRAAAVLILEDGTEYAHRGEIQFSEVIVDQGTGSVTLRAVFPNPDGLLMPGMFVRARVEEGTIDQALLVPQQAVLRTPRGEPMAYVVNAQDVVEQRILKTSRAIGTNWLVTDGLAAGDRVVMEGVQRIRPGAKVAVTEAPPRPGQVAAAD
ncbi:efflux RND transporter periplasmic adaptor subunit [Neoroseomonas lacus]|uniref:MexX family efflux pump subunit n=1 Tax=Neoroseomonas lacus TaxID=287609 RepID=A0A917KJL1_9PROT|nr:efflux RND transporter periplasmic adaptor subunit [Neoroseomonas lacus]GGJ12398.1 MexX family efflux pump subunit [Neoroseomonas lacus]